MPSPIVIRRATVADEAALHDVCLRTGDAGNDATGLLHDGSLYGSIYAVPYVHLAPEFAFVAQQGAAVVGYVVGALDTEAFEARCEAEWWPALRARHPQHGTGPGTGTGTGTVIDRRLVRAIHHPTATDERVLTSYPSHLHINLLPAAQGMGVGRQLIDTLFTALRAAGSIGVHLGVDPRNTRAIGFYEHLGMRRHDHDGGVLFTQRFVPR